MNQLAMMGWDDEVYMDEFSRESHDEAFRVILDQISGADNFSPVTPLESREILDLLQKVQRSMDNQNLMTAKKYCKEIILGGETEGKIQNNNVDEFSCDYGYYIEQIEMNGTAHALLLLGDCLRREGNLEDAAVVYQELLFYYSNSSVYDIR